MSELSDQIRHDVTVLDLVREHLAGRHEQPLTDCLACELAQIESDPIERSDRLIAEVERLRANVSVGWLTCDISRDLRAKTGLLREMHLDHVADQIGEAADQLDSLITLLAEAETTRDEARAELAEAKREEAGSGEWPNGRYIMATRATHVTGDLSRDKPDLAVVYSQVGDDYIGNWRTGFGFINVHFPGASTRNLTEQERDFYAKKSVVGPGGIESPALGEADAGAGDLVGSFPITGEEQP